MKFGVITFPGSNCDYDAYTAVKSVLGESAEFLWHKSTNLADSDVVIVSGGFSYGDYLRAGAIARFSPIVESVVKFARAGGVVIGICNGFQILTECGLLPGALMRNDQIRFSSRWVYLRVENNQTPFTQACAKSEVLKIPMAHGEGNYYADDKTLRQLEGKGLVVFRYVTADGQVTAEANPNGSCNNIAGIMNEGGNVLGLMPHPERAVESLLGSTDGLQVFASLRAAFAGNHHREAVNL